MKEFISLRRLAVDPIGVFQMDGATWVVERAYTNSRSPITGNRFRLHAARIDESYASRCTTDPVGQPLIIMKASVLRQASLPSQDNLSSSKGEIQQPGVGDDAKTHSRPRQQASDERDDSRRHQSAANDSTKERPTLSLISIQEVMGQTRIGRTMIYELAKNNEFPRPVKVGGASRWIREEISDWIRALALKRP
jgi:predicted DNA-binding transcriptional regulator AlpA